MLLRDGRFRSSRAVSAVPLLSLVFGTGKGSRQDLLATINSSFGGVVNGLVRVPVGMPGMPLP